jgi:Aspartyl protease
MHGKLRTVFLVLLAAAGLRMGVPAAIAQAEPATLPPTEPTAESTAEPAAEPLAEPITEESLTEIVIQAPEPRYVAPTRRDRIGRIWAPVYINGKGPFRLVLDTGATNSGVTAEVADALDIPLNRSAPIRLRGVTGTTTVPTIHVDSLTVGELVLGSKRLPILPNALGGAQGVLGTEGLNDKRIHIDFLHDSITITRSNRQQAPVGYETIPVKFARGRLLVFDALMGSTRIKAILDTGGQATIGNLAMRDAVMRFRRKDQPTIDTIVGVTDDEEKGEGFRVPPIMFGTIEMRTSRITFGDLHIFKQWNMTDEPTLLIGMDALGLLDTLIIDYSRAELQIRIRARS